VGSFNAEKLERLAPGPDAAVTLVRVDAAACQRLAALLASQHIPRDEEDSVLTGFDRNEVGNFYLLLVAICHQTSPRGRLPLEGTVAGKRKRGWDYLSAKLEEAARSNRGLLDPARWATLSVEDFLALFRDQEFGDRLFDPERRVALVQDLGRVILEDGRRWFEDLYQACGGRAATGDPNLFGLLSRFAAYSDPVRKKSSFLLALMRNSGHWRYVDDDKVGPPVDYHEVRGHLRIGTVVVTSLDLRRKLLNGLPVTAEEDIALRGAVYDAILLMSELTGLRNPSQLHYLFWNVFRTHCLRESPLCFQPAPTLPERYQPLAGQGGERHCPFAAVCMSASKTQRYYEHVFETDYY
jgi:hypothetical protein